MGREVVLKKLGSYAPPMAHSSSKIIKGNCPKCLWIALKRTNLVYMLDSDANVNGTNLISSLIPTGPDRRTYYRYCTLSNDDMTISFAEIELPKGTWVVLRNLQQRTDLNGREGKIVGTPKGPCDTKSQGRYAVLVAGTEEDAGEVVNVKPEKMWI